RASSWCDPLSLHDALPIYEVYGIKPIIGTVRYNPDIVEYFKLEIGRGEEPTEWLTIGETDTEQVEDDVLEYLHADALAPGPYILDRKSTRLNSSHVKISYA